MITEVELATVCDIRSGGTPSRGKKEYYGGKIPWVKIGDLEESDHIMETEEYISESGLRAIRGRLFPPGTLLFAIYGTMGKMAFAGTELATNQAILGIQPRDNAKIDLRYLYHYLNCQVSDLQADGRGVTQKNLSATYLRGLRVPLPAIERQRRIAAILDKATCVIRKRENLLAMANEFLASVLLDMFGDLELNPKRWSTCALSDLLKTDPQNGLYRPSRDYGSGTQIIRIDSFYDGYLITSKPLKRLTIDNETLTKYRLADGDIVINRVNSREYLGKSALVEGLPEDTVFESNMMRFRVNSGRVNSRFLVDQLQTEFIKRQILRASKDAVNQSSINQTDVSNLQIRVPPITLQRLYANIVAKKRKNDATLNLAREEANSLFLSLSQRCFIDRL